MRRARGVALLFLAAAGILLLVVATGMVWGGLAIPGLIRAQIPDAALVDTAQVGGAMVALGGLAGLVGALHLLLIPGVRRLVPGVLVAGITLAVTLAVLALASAVGALVALASASGSPQTMLPAALGLALVGLAYAWLGAALVSLRGAGSPN